MVNKQSTKHLNDLTLPFQQMNKLSERIGKHYLLFKQMNKLTDE